MNIDEPIHLEGFTENWSRMFTEEQQLLSLHLADWVEGIEHFGSTAIDGMTAKPIIDILIGVGHMDRVKFVTGKIQECGYEFLGEAGIIGRLYFRKRGQRSFNAHVVSYEGALWNDNLLLRNYLRVHKEEAVRYGDFKKQIVQKGAQTLLDYSNQKNKFVREVLARAKAWHKANT
ncbi:GrpB family protein [Brevibacillus formosus]|uniref:GrpB family protein n=1 Tax=Brevibacillus formosus TaxID=54913 RepID=A0A837KKK9_9BACL|nr:GrpB family protein [Brevibacillus formosus]KLH97984.1 hypothetical protein AA984_19170 [Brevibacillus formosus]MED1957197.1 GrpB family protein [Brevibacillus formosus]PSJ91412.1 GrpB family protein [Brevibacillus formosus]GED57312.1 hypothetical protein BFO01nite_14440 [Brevibacillus formosus]